MQQDPGLADRTPARTAMGALRQVLALLGDVAPRAVAESAGEDVFAAGPSRSSGKRRRCSDGFRALLRADCRPRPAGPLVEKGVAVDAKLSGYLDEAVAEPVGIEQRRQQRVEDGAARLVCRPPGNRARRAIPYGTISSGSSIAVRPSIPDFGDERGCLAPGGNVAEPGGDEVEALVGKGAAARFRARAKRPRPSASPCGRRPASGPPSRSRRLGSSPSRRRPLCVAGPPRARCFNGS